MATCVVSVAGTEIERRILYQFGSLSLSSSDKRCMDRDLMKVSISAGGKRTSGSSSSCSDRRLPSIIVWRFHRQVLKLAEVFRFIVFQGAITPERFHWRTSICRMEGRENKSHMCFR